MAVVLFSLFQVNETLTLNFNCYFKVEKLHSATSDLIYSNYTSCHLQGSCLESDEGIC